MRDHFATLWISSQAAIRVSRTRRPEDNSEPQIAASLRTKSCVLSMSAGHFVYSARTSQGTQTVNSTPSSVHWKDWVTALRLEFSARKKQAIATNASGSLSWPTPRASAAMSGKLSEGYETKAKLENAVAKWRSPTAVTSGVDSDTLLNKDGTPWLGHTETPYVAGTGRKAQVGLEQQVAKWSTPMAADCGAKATIASHQRSRIADAYYWTIPTTQYQAPQTTDGQNSLNEHTISPQRSRDKRLNVLFVEALMRWPTGLSGFDTQETVLTPYLALMRMHVLTLCNARQETTENKGFFY
jgi:hypothetical protein